MATKLQLRDRVLRLLWSKPAVNIDFTFDGVHFAGRYFNLVASAIMSKWVGHKGIDFRTGQVPAGAGAAYDPDADAIDVPGFGFGATAWERMALIHECFHAWRDVMGPKVPGKGGPVTTLAVKDEAMAYITGELFTIHERAATGAAPSVPDWATEDPHAGAFMIAESIWRTKAAVVPASSAKLMYEAVRDDPTYALLKKSPTFRYGNNGV